LLCGGKKRKIVFLTQGVDMAVGIVKLFENRKGVDINSLCL
jgi:hypothetical protein